MTPSTDVLVGDDPIGSSAVDAVTPGAGSCTVADLDVMDAVHELQVEEVAYRATLQALEAPFVAGLRRFLG